MDKYFKKMDSLVDTEKKDIPKNDVDAGYFHSAGDLTSTSSIQENADYFHHAGDLDDDKAVLRDSPGKPGFRSMDDLVDTGKKNFPKNDVDVTGYFHRAGDLTPISTVQEMTDYFMPAGDLDTQGKNIILPKGNTEHIVPFKNPDEIVDYFRPAGDLDTQGKNIILPKGNTEHIVPFKNPDEIVDYFRPAGDLNKEINIEKIYEKNKINMMKNKEDINDYLLTVVSGKKYPSVCELGVLMGSGRMIIGLNELMKMVEEGYNIVSANVINADRDMIEVEFQRYIYNEELMEKRRRF